MLTSIRQSDLKRVVGCEIEKNLSATYHCDYCGEEVIHHRSLSQVKIGHFKHKAHTFCANNISESQDHLKAKKGIKDYLKNKFKSFRVLELEKWICNKSIRPDIYIETKKGNKIAIEVQASQLTIDQIIRRTKKYYDNNIYVLWLLIWNKSKMSSTDYVLRKCYRSNDCYYSYPNNCDHSVKLTEMELFLQWMNFKKLLFWDNEHGEAFYLVNLENYVGEGSEFYSSDGELQQFDGRIAKNKKLITSIRFDVEFNDFKPRTIPEFKIPSKKYAIPRRKQLSV